MTPFALTLHFGAFFSLYLLVAWLDHKYNWQLADWMNGKCDNPFAGNATQSNTQVLAEKDQRIAELTERVQVLERIVTEPAYELNKKINQLD